MAEERLIDDDKDKKYKIRKNADGEDELYLDMEGGEEPEESVEFEVPEFETDDEEAAVLTPEQLAERERLKKEEEERRRKRVDELSAKAKTLVEEQSYEGALYAIEEAEGLIPEDGEVALIKLLAATENLRTFSGEGVSAAVSGVEKYSTKEQKEAVIDRLPYLKGEAETLEKEVEKLNETNEAGKAERRKFYTKKRKNALIFFASVGVPFLVFLILGIYFSSVMHAVKDGRNIIFTIVFFAIAGVLFIALLFAAHRLWDSAKHVSQNEKNSENKIGREYESKKTQYELINRIIAAIEGKEEVEAEREGSDLEENDIS